MNETKVIKILSSTDRRIILKLFGKIKDTANYERFEIQSQQTVSNFYELLSIDKTSDNSVVTEVIEQKVFRARKMANHATDFAGNLQKLLSEGEKILTKQRKEYNNLIAFQDYIPSVNFLEQQLEIIVDNNTINDKKFQRIISQVSCNNNYPFPDQWNSFKNQRSIVAALAHGYLQTKNINIVQDQQICPKCKTINPGGSNICSECGAYINCPGCNSQIKKGAVKCNGCGVEIADLNKYVLLLDELERNITKNQVYLAENQLADVSRFWGKNERVIHAKIKLQEAKDQILSQEETIEKLLQQNKFYEGNRFLLKMDVLGSVSLEEKRKYIQQKLAKAKEFVDQAYKQSSVEKKIDAYCSALRIVSDYQDALAGLKSNPPKAPTSLQAKITGRTVLLTWDKCMSNNISYTVVRKVNGSPQGPSDGERIADITSNHYDDTDTIPGVSYYYAVYSKCADIVSRSATQTGPVLKMAEIDSRKISYNIFETSIRFSFELPENAKCVELYRDNRLIGALSYGSCNDTNLTTERQYFYKFITVFEDCLGKKHKTKGLTFSLRPTAPPQTIPDLEYQIKDHSVSLSWTKPDKGEAYILETDNPLGLGKGTLVPLGKLKSMGMPLPLISQSSTKKKLTKSGTLCFSVWTIFGQSAIFGKEVEVSNIDSVSHTKVVLSMGKLFLEWEWPMGIRMAIITYSNQSFEDPRAAKIRVTKESYDREGAYVIRNVRNADYYFTIYSCHNKNNKELHSIGKRVFFSNTEPMDLEYSIRYKKLFGKKLELKIRGKIDQVLPDLVLVAKDGSVPIKKDDGIEILQLKGVKSNSSHRIGLDEISLDRYVRLFVKEKGACNIRILTPHKEKLKLF